MATTALVGAIERTLAPPPPAAGFAAVINKPHPLLVLVRRPWAPEPTPGQPLL